MPAETSLRERSKARRRAAIQRAAFTLFADQGYDGTTIAEIADAAEVAPRSVSMYFPSKLDLALSMSSDVTSRLVEVFTAHPELDFTGVVDLWLQGESEAVDPDLHRLSRAMYEANPDLRSVATGHIGEVTSVAKAALIAELGLPEDDPMFLIAGAVVGAVVGTYLNSEHVPDQHDRVVRYLRDVIAAAR